MTLYFLRHAIARDRADWRGKDSERPLTKEGVRKVRKAIRGLKRFKLSFDWILTSPYKRAYDTAAIMAETFKAKKKLKVTEALIAEGDPQHLVEHLAKAYSPKDALVLVGHEPYLSRLVSVLIGASQPLDLDFKKGGLSRLETDKLRYGRCAKLKWWLSPKLMKNLCAAALALTLAPFPARAADTLANWTETVDQKETQYKILSKVFGGMGSISTGKRNPSSGRYFFSKNGSWVNLGKDVVFDPGTPAGAPPYLAVTCSLYHEPDRPPINTTAYLFRDVTQRPMALSAGYAAQESVYQIALPKLKKSFLLLVDYSSETGSNGQWSAFLLDSPTRSTRTPRTVWKSPSSAKSFQIGFNDLGGSAEDLLFRTERSGQVQYTAFRWSGDRFEEDSFVFGSRLKDLPGDVWQYGASR